MKKFQEYLAECKAMSTYGEAFRIQGDAFTDYILGNLTIEEYRSIYWLCEHRMNRLCM